MSHNEETFDTIEQVAKDQRGFTLIELLATTAIIAIVAAILLPVFRSAEGAAESASCISNVHQVGLATMQYLNDYDDTYMPARYQLGPNASSRNDRTWVQLLLPYASSFAIFHCPADSSFSSLGQSTFDQDLVPGDLLSRYYSASLKSDYGYNYMAFSPFFQAQGHWQVLPKNQASLPDLSTMMIFVDSAGALGTQAASGGAWVVNPPCKYADYNGQRVDIFASASGIAGNLYTFGEGWIGGGGPAAYGGAWPRHNGHMNMALADGHVVSVSPSRLASGCDVQTGLVNTTASADESGFVWMSVQGGRG